MNSPLDVIMPTPVPLPNEDVSISDYTKHAVLRKMSTNEYYSIIDIDNGKFDDLAVDSCIFDVLDTLGMNEIYDDRFDMILTTNDTETFLKYTTEEL